MAQHYTDIHEALRQRFPSAYNSIIIDFSETIDRNKVNRGAEISLRLWMPSRDEEQEIVNICLGDSHGENYSMDVFNSKDYED